MTEPEFERTHTLKVARHLAHPGSVFDDLRPVASLEQMPNPPMFPIEPNGIADVQPTDGVVQVRFQGLNQQMIIISSTLPGPLSEHSPSFALLQGARDHRGQLFTINI